MYHFSSSYRNFSDHVWGFIVRLGDIMKRSIFIFVIIWFLGISTGFTQEEMSSSELTLIDGLAYKGDADKPFTGVMHNNNEEDEQFGIFTFKDGILHGLVETYWNIDKDLRSRGYAVNNNRSGTIEFFDKEGRLELIQTFKNDVFFVAICLGSSSCLFSGKAYILLQYRYSMV